MTTSHDAILAHVEARWSSWADSFDDGGDADTAMDTALPWAGGVAADTLRATVAPLVDRIAVHDLAGEAALWGREVSDERYVLVAHAA